MQKSSSLKILRDYLSYSRNYWRPLALYLITVPAAILSSSIFIPILVKQLVDLFIGAASVIDSAATIDQATHILILICAALVGTVLIKLVSDLSISQVKPFVVR